jgi:23S rRNA (uracil1939-C5)-methyltransferase
MLFLTMMRKVHVPIDSVAFKGYGVARIHGKVAFVPYTVTGDKAWVEVIEEKKRYSMGRLIQLTEPSPWRVNPPYPYFGSCGGCQWQHVDYSVQTELKEQILRDLLKRLGRLKEIPSIRVVPSPKSYDYRIRIRWATTKKGPIRLWISTAAPSRIPWSIGSFGNFEGNSPSRSL